MNYVLGLIFNKNKTEIALIRKDRPIFQKGLLNGIGGKIENNETEINAMIRECEEETTLVTVENDWIPFGKYVFNEGINSKSSIFLYATIIDDLNVLNCKESEVIEIHSITNLMPNNTVNDLIFFIEKALNII